MDNWNTHLDLSRHHQSLNKKDIGPDCNIFVWSRLKLQQFDHVTFLLTIKVVHYPSTNMQTHVLYFFSPFMTPCFSRWSYISGKDILKSFVSPFVIIGPSRKANSVSFIIYCNEKSTMQYDLWFNTSNFSLLQLHC